MKSPSTLTWIARLALGVALIISIYLAWTSLAGNKVAGCSAEGSGCNAVLSSRWGSVFGLPVSLMGLPIYSALLFLSWHQSPRGQIVLNSLSTLVVGAALWFGAVQTFVLHAFCPWCCTTHGFAVTGVLLLWLARAKKECGYRRSALPWAVALPCLLAMIALQAFGPAPAETLNRTLGSAGGAVIDADRNVTLHGGRFVIDPSSLPGIGSPQATRHAVALTDYTCGYCRKLHHQLDRAVAAYQPGSISVIELPVARDATAAEIQRLMLSIWRLERSAKTALELQIFNGQLAVDPSAIRAEAEKLLGAEQVANALATYGEWADEQIDLASAILEANREVTGVAHLPQLIVGEEVNIGASRDLDLYLGLFEDHLGLERPDDEALALALAATTPPRPAPRAQPRGPAFVPGPPARVVRAAGGAPPTGTKVPAGYFSWMLDHFAMPDEISIAAPSQNPDFDDDRNSFEYWCRQNPRLRDTRKSGLPQRGSEGRLTFTLQLRDDDPDLEGFIEFADDLHFTGQFHRQIPFSSLTPSDPDPADGLVSWFAADPELARAQRFVRALIEIPWPQDLECVAGCAHVAVRTCESDPLRLRDFFHMCLDTCQQGRCEGATAMVCGCDGVTYETACEAARARVGVDHLGACGSPPCNSNADCDAADYCEFEEGCTGPGTCKVRPEVCPATFDPVCGCDGITYDNSCQAAVEGMNVAHVGACGPSPCNSNAECGVGDYCEFESGCTGPGTCTVRPLACPAVFDPVCGCDGRTYGNACEAAAAGVNVTHEGACTVGACNSNADCGAADYCLFEDGCTGPGSCTARPLFCPENFDPVCGCDGKTYGNACEAAAAGVNVDHIGACPPAPCNSNADCGAADYCEFDSGCTGPGTCKIRPRVCLAVFDPVCGCDGRTYGNACEAAAAGINVAHEGACIVPRCNSNADCGAADYCLFDTGCSGPGVCTTRPNICPDVFDPVCGCDGATYGNACEAAAAGINVAAQGACQRGRIPNP